MGTFKTSDEIRRTFTEFFVERGHLAVPSASLVPSALDQSVLLTTAGMQPFKPYFLGQAAPPAPRLTSVQRCFRAVDIDVVGSTERHMTFFQMMGNFSFGDYFKPGAVAMAYELSTGPYGLDPERIWATVYEGDEQLGPDDVARELWLEQGVPASASSSSARTTSGRPARPARAGRARSSTTTAARSTAAAGADCKPGCDCDRFLEFWNLVFMEFDRGDDGSLTPLPAQNIDTGSGLERVAMLLQEAGSIFETDETAHVISARRAPVRPALRRRRRRRALVPGALRPRSRHGGDRNRRRHALQRGPRLRPAPDHPARRAPRHAARPRDAVPRRAARGRDRVARRRLPGARASTATTCVACSRPRRRASRRRSRPARGCSTS